MKKTDNTESFQIRVNTLSLEKEKLIPYSKYIKNDYPQLKKVVPKHSILYKAKYRPEIIINEFHQTSNNYNTNINIKTNSNNNSSNTHNFNIKLNDGFNNIYNNTDHLNYNNKNNNIKDNLKINKNKENKSPLNIKKKGKTIEVNKKNKNEKIINSVRYKKYYNHKNVKIGPIDLYNNSNKLNTEGGETSVESINSSGNNINKILFFSSKKANVIENTIKNIGNIKDPAVEKMEIYRTKLFNEFLKHFKNYCKTFLKNYFENFFNEIKMYKKEKQIVKNRTIDNYYNKRVNKNFILLANNSNEHTDDINVNDILKSSTTKDYYKIYTQLKKFSNSNLKSIFNSYNNTDSNIISNDISDKNKSNNSISLSLNKAKNMDLTPRVNKNLDFSSMNRRKVNQSPSFHIGNRTYTNRDLSFGKEKIEKNELFRDSRELNKKYEQIQRRRKKIHFINKSMSALANRSLDNQINISNEFNQIKKYIKENKNERKSQNSKKIIVGREKRNKLNDKIVRITNINGKKYKIMKVNKNKNLMNKNNIFSSKKIKKENKLFSIIIKNIVTKDNLMHININYYFLKDKNKSIKARFNSLQKTKTFSVSILLDRKKDIKNKLKLTSIKEEDISIHNSKIYDENDSIKKKSNKDKALFDFIKIINDILIKCYKKYFIYKIKTIESFNKINSTFNHKINEINNFNNKIYSKKIGYRKNKNKVDEKSEGIYNKKNDEILIKKIFSLRAKLIKYSINI